MEVFILKGATAELEVLETSYLLSEEGEAELTMSQLHLSPELCLYSIKRSFSDGGLHYLQR